MRARLFQIDAFASKRFTGNPAAVIPLEQFPAEGVMQAIAEENNLAETAFIVPLGRDYRIRWFTPTNEVPLCGHATLASAAVVMDRLEPDRNSVTFYSASGPLIDRVGVIVTAQGDAPYDFVSRYFAPAQGVPEDPVTGSAHCALAPYWSVILGKSEFLAFQASRRGGEVRCKVFGNRVELSGTCVFYLEGQAEI